MVVDGRQAGRERGERNSEREGKRRTHTHRHEGGGLASLQKVLVTALFTGDAKGALATVEVEGRMAPGGRGATPNSCRNTASILAGLRAGRGDSGP